MFIINKKSLDYAMATKIYAWNECGDEIHINGNRRWQWSGQKDKVMTTKPPF
jgi:hypothetical protein